MIKKTLNCLFCYGAFFALIVVAQTPVLDGLLVDFGPTAKENKTPVPGWTTVFKQMFTDNVALGPGGLAIVVGKNSDYNHQGVKGTPVPFVKNTRITVRWYSNFDAPITFKPKISFIDSGEPGNTPKANWYLMSETQIYPGGIAISKFDIPDSLAGTYGLINIAAAYGTNKGLVFDKLSVFQPKSLDQSPPQTPLAPQMQTLTSGLVILNWASASDDKGVDAYHVYKDGVLFKTVANLSFRDSTVLANKSYTYQVMAFDEQGNSSALSPQLVVSTPSYPDSLGLSIESYTSKQAMLGWRTLQNKIQAASYKLYRNGAVRYQGALTSYTDLNLSPATSYVYKVEAFDAQGIMLARSGDVSLTLPDLGNALRAFPGAEGFGAAASGGRGGKVMIVTNKNPLGPGSLRDAFQATEPRIVVFRASGVFNVGKANANSQHGIGFGCAAPCSTKQAHVTVAGQTAPGGVTVISDKWGSEVLNTYGSNFTNGIFRFLRVYAYKKYGNNQAIGFAHASNFIFDHCTFSGGDDESASFTVSHHFTLQWSMVANPTGEDEAKGSLIAYRPSSHITLHHNLWAHTEGRGGPEMHWARIEGEDPSLHGVPPDYGMVDYRNNVCYNYSNWGSFSLGIDGDLRLNMVGNYWKDGPITDTPGRMPFKPASPGNTKGPINLGQAKFAKLYMKDNVWEDQELTVEDKRILYDANNAPQPTFTDTAWFMPAVTTTSGKQAYLDVLSKVGSLPHDPMTKRVVDEVRTYKGTLRNDSAFLLDSMPIPDLDSDYDGMPDWWEIHNGLNPLVQDHNGVSLSRKYTGVEGYTNIECYINRVADNLINDSLPLIVDKPFVYPVSILEAKGVVPDLASRSIRFTIKPKNPDQVKKVSLSLANLEDPFALSPAPPTDISASRSGDEWIHSYSLPANQHPSTFQVLARVEDASGLVGYAMVNGFKMLTQDSLKLPQDSLPTDSIPRDSLPLDSIPHDSIPSDSLPQDSSFLNKPVRGYPTEFMPSQGDFIISPVREGDKVYILTPYGLQIKVLKIKQTGRTSWDGVGDNGMQAQSGVYHYLILDSQGAKKAKGKFILVR